MKTETEVRDFIKEIYEYYGKVSEIMERFREVARDLPLEQYEELNDLMMEMCRVCDSHGKEYGGVN